MDNKNSEMIVNGANPSIIWTQYMDLLSEYGKYMKSIYTKRMRANKPITWNDLDVINKKIHDQLDYKMTRNEKFNQSEVTESIQRKNKVRLTESQLHNVIRKCINEALNEGGHLYWKDEDGNIHTNSRDTWHGVEGTVFISHGEWSDPEVLYDGEEINGTDLEDAAWDNYRYECESNKKKPSEEEFDNLPSEWFKDYLDYDYMPACFGEG